jgi:hypothetical protein
MKKKTYALNEFQHHVRKSWGTHQGFAQGRGRLKESDIVPAAQWLKKSASANVGPFGDFQPSSIKSLRRKPVFPEIDGIQEIRWAAATVSAFRDELNEFVSLVGQYEIELLNGRYDYCEQLLNELDHARGFSLWAIENRLALYQLQNGLEKQKGYLKTLVDSGSHSNILSYICYACSHRNEDTTTPGRFSDLTRLTLGDAKIESSVRRYLLSRTLNEFPDQLEYLAPILRHELSSNIVDYYDTFVRVSHELLLSDDNSQRTLARDLLVFLAPQIPDPRIVKAAYLATGNSAYLKDLPHRNLKAESLMYAGHASMAHSEANQIRQTQPEDLSNYLTEAIAAAQLDAPKPANRLGDVIVDRLRAIVAKSDGFREAALGAAKMGLNFRLLPFVDVAGTLSWFEFDELPVMSLSHRQKIFLSSKFVDLLPHLSPTVGLLYAREVETLCTHETPIAFFLAQHSASPDALLEDEDVLPEVVSEVQMLRSLHAGDFTSALVPAETLCNSDQERFQRIGHRAFAFCLWNLDRVTDLIHFVSKICLTDPRSVDMLPLLTCAGALGKARRREMAAELSTSIVLDMCCKHASDDFTAERNYAYEDFLISQGLQRPSDLQSSLSRYPTQELIYYLREICRPDIMQMSTVFSGSKELEDERIAVCSILTELDSVNSKLYESEAREITRAQLIRLSVRQVEQSKIYVNLSAIRHLVEKEQTESFARYQALTRIGAGLENDTLVAELTLALALRKPIPRRLLEIPKNEAYEILVQMIPAIFRECISNAEHGLDCYLSMRIRHGTLSGQLRSPLEDHHLITQRKSGSDDYIENDYWGFQLYELDPDARQSVVEKLKSFSREYDNFISGIANDLIQIKSDVKPHGLFDTTITHIRLRAFAASITPDMTFDRFLDLTFELFWETTEVCLSRVRDVIDQELKPLLNELFHSLDADVTALANGKSCAALTREIKLAQTASQNSLERVKDWFHLPAPVVEPPLALEQLVDIGLEMVQSIHRSFKPQLYKDLAELPPFARALTMFSDIFFIIFDNIRRHSALDRPNVNIVARDLGETLNIRVENEVGIGLISKDLVDKIEGIKGRAFGAGYEQAVISEGGTGLIKLLKIVGRDREFLDFGFVEDKKFYVTFSLKKVEFDA